MIGIIGYNPICGVKCEKNIRRHGVEIFGRFIVDREGNTNIGGRFWAASVRGR